MQIDADADHKRAYRAGFALDGRFREDTAQLASVHQHVVHPFDLRREACGLLNGAYDRDRRRNGDERQVRQRQCRMQQNGHVHAGVGRGDERAAEPSASAGLLLGKQREAVSAAEILLLHRRVGRGKRRLDQDFASDDRGVEQRVNACGGQAVIIRGQAIAFSGHGVNGKAALAQCGDRLVHRRTGYAKLLGQPSAGKAGASCLFECLQNGVLHGQFDHLHH